jgi:dolichol kinase
LNYREIIRKSLHIILSLILLLPFILSYSRIVFDKALFYSVLSILALTFNAIQIKRPLLRSEVKRFMRENREKFFADIKNFIPVRGQVTGHVLDKIEEKIRGVEDLIDYQLSTVERDYEKRGGYVGLTYGILGVTLSYFLFNDYAFYGVISLATTDAVATIVGGLTGTHRLPFTDKTVEGSVSGFLVFLTALILIGTSPLDSLILSIVAMIVEAYAIEDNLLLPIFVSFLATFIV